jgi:hypothetical protein
MALSDYLKDFSLVEAAFSRQGLAITLPQAEAIALELLPLFAANKPAPAPVPVPVPVPTPPPPPPVEATPYTLDQIRGFYEKYLGREPESEAIVEEWSRNPKAEENIAHSTEAIQYSQYTAAHTVPHTSVLFDHDWTGTVPTALRTLLAMGLAGPDGSNGQAVIDKLQTYDLGPDANGEFQPHHNGPAGLPTYGFPKFYVSYVPLSAGGGPIPDDGSGRSYYQIVVFG